MTRQIAAAYILAAVGVALMSRLPQLLPGQQELSWYQSPFMIAGIILVIIALLLLVPSGWWKNLGILPKRIFTIYMWKRYGPSYSLEKLSVQQPVSNHGDIYKAIISLHIKNRDDDSLKVSFDRVKFNLTQRFGRRSIWVILSPPTGFPQEKEIAPHKEADYEVPFVGWCGGVDYPNLNKPYQWEIRGIQVFLSEVGWKELRKGQ